LASIDLSGGEMRTTEGPATEFRVLADEMFKISAKELVVPAGEEDRLDRAGLRSFLGAALLSPFDPWAFEGAQARNCLMDHLGVRSLAGFGLEDKPLAAAAAGGLLAYLKKVRKDSLALVHKVSYAASSQSLVLDAAAIRNLELVKNLRDGRVKDSLLDVIDFTVTPMAGRLLRAWLLRPLIDSAPINARLDAVEELLGRTIERQELRDTLKGVLDLERLAGKISLGAGHPRDLVALKRSLLPLPKLGTQLGLFSSALLGECAAGWDNGREIGDLVERSILDEPAFLLTEGGIIKDGYHPALDDLRRVSRSGKAFITDLEKRELSLFDPFRKLEIVLNFEAALHYRFVALWTRSPRSPFYCLEPWTSLPNSFSREEDLILLEPGKTFQAGPRPEGVEMGEMGKCYYNATMLVMNDSTLHYAEGFASPSNLQGMAFLHAWAVTDAGQVIDTTWPDQAGATYFGVEYDRAAYLRAVYKSRTPGVIGGRAGAAQRAAETGAPGLRRKQAA